jgi:photosystem II stability/assembly factor-like uncharacterized protein
MQPPTVASRRFVVSVLAACAAGAALVSPAGWASSGSQRPPAGAQALPQVTEYDSLLVSAHDASRVLLGTQHGLFRSADGGRSWTPAGLHGDRVTSLSRSGGTILAGGVGLLASSSDGGRSWRRLHPRGLPNQDIDALGADSSAVYVVVRGGGLYRSIDLAHSFRSISLMVGPAIRALALTATDIIAGDVATGIYVSTNGHDWLHTANGAIMALAVGGRDGDQVLAASWGIARSSDGGARWRTALRSHVVFGAVAWAPGDDSVAYAVGDNRTFWRSTDAGLHWSEMTGSR